MKNHDAINMMKKVILDAHREGFMQGHSCGKVCGLKGNCNVNKEYLQSYNDSQSQRTIDALKPTDH